MDPDSSPHAANLETLRQQGGVRQKRGTTIRAGPYDPKTTAVKSKNCRVIHFQRHGQAYHNLLADEFRRLGEVRKASYVHEANLDPPLTAIGREQARAQQQAVQDLHPSVLLVSPLHRTIQTALITWKHVSGSSCPFIAIEDARETLGEHACDRRRPWSETALEVGDRISFTMMPTDEDTLWTAEHRETGGELAERAFRFMLQARAFPAILTVTYAHTIAPAVASTTGARAQRARDRRGRPLWLALQPDECGRRGRATARGAAASLRDGRGAQHGRRV